MPTRFNPGDIVRRTGPSEPSYNLFQGHTYTIVSQNDADGEVRLEGIRGDWWSQFFELVEPRKVKKTSGFKKFQQKHK